MYPQFDNLQGGTDMRNLSIILLCGLLAAWECGVGIASGDVVTLKNGGTFSGKIISTNDKSTTIQVGGGKVTLQAEQIASVHKDVEAAQTTATSSVSPNIPARTDVVDLGNGVKLEMVWIPGGTFQMGSPGPNEKDDKGNKNEKPIHTVELDGFWIGKTEVTQTQWEVMMGTDIRQQREKAEGEIPPLVGEGPDNPMFYVSWEDAGDAFLASLSRDRTVSHTSQMFQASEYLTEHLGHLFITFLNLKAYKIIYHIYPISSTRKKAHPDFYGTRV